MLFGSNSFPSLYQIALKTFVRWKDFDILWLSDLPGFIKEDILKTALLFGKCKEQIGVFLHPDIRRLDISGCKISCEDLENLSKCRKMLVLEMNPNKYQRYDHPSLALESLFSQLCHLVKLHVQRNDGMTDNVMRALVRRSCSCLQELDVSGCISLTDEGAKYMGSLTHIRAINLSDTFITNKGLLELSDGPSSQSLAELKLNNCVSISDEGINAVVNSCNRLRILVFCGCPKVSVDCQLSMNAILGKDKKLKLVTWTVYF